MSTVAPTIERSVSVNKLTISVLPAWLFRIEMTCLVFIGYLGYLGYL